MYILSTESTGFSSHTKTQAFSDVVKTKEISIVGSKNLKRLPTLWNGQAVASELGIYHIRHKREATIICTFCSQVRGQI